MIQGACKNQGGHQGDRNSCRDNVVDMSDNVIIILILSPMSVHTSEGTSGCHPAILYYLESDR